MTSNTVYFPGLNGLRAIAAIAVVLSHTTQSLTLFHLDPTILGTFEDGVAKGIDLGGHGVSIFFCLSGFLITYLLRIEKEKYKTINIKAFYLRRILRIWPLYYLYFAIAVLVIIIWRFDLDINTVLFYIFFMANVPFIMDTSLAFLSHYWSIGVEEQFYLVWPWLNKQKYSTLILCTTLLIVGMMVTKLLLHFMLPNSLMESIIHITRFHCMMIGALGALLYEKKNPLLIKLFDNKIIQVASWCIILSLAINQYHVASVLDTEIISVIGLCIIIGQIQIKNRIVNLETPVFDFLGKISYGIYVIHPLIIFLFSKCLADIQVHSIVKHFIIYASIMGTTILLAYLSYEYYEKIFLRIKTKYTTVISSSSRS